MNIKFYKTHEDAQKPTCAYNGTSAGYDLTSVETVTIEPKSSQIVRNGLKIEVPHGFYYTIDSRSGLGINKDTICFRGIIDAGYTGDILIKVYNLSDVPVTINKGDKYAQIIFHKLIELDFEEVDESKWESEVVAHSVRGSNGFGSSGN